MPQLKLQSSLTRREYIHSALSVLLRDFGYRISAHTRNNQTTHILQETPNFGCPARHLGAVRDIIDAVERLIPILRNDEFHARYTRIMAENNNIQYKGEGEAI